MCVKVIAKHFLRHSVDHYFFKAAVVKSVLFVVC